MSRRRIIAGNWKMNKTPSEAKALCEELIPLVKNDDVDVVFCVPAIDIGPVAEAVKGTNVKVGAENFYIEDKGAFTGEISAPMLKDAGVEYIIIGHSERRDIFGENDILINAKVKKAFEAGLKPILCCGESLALRKAGTYKEWIERQIKWDLTDITADQVLNLISCDISKIPQLIRLRTLLSLTSLSGLSEQARLLQLIRLRKFASLSVILLQRCMTQLQQRLFVSSTAAQ